MIDFKNGTFAKLKKIDPGSVGNNLTALLIPNENIIGAYKGMRDYVVFTDKRFISVNVQGLTGKKQDLTPGKYTILTSIEGVENFNVRINGLVSDSCVSSFCGVIHSASMLPCERPVIK